MNMTPDAIWLQFACAALTGYCAKRDMSPNHAAALAADAATYMMTEWKDYEQRPREPPMTAAEIVKETLMRR
jgi:hypothetical protein